MKGKRQIPSNSNNWLYQDWSEDERIFSKKVFLADNADEWAECTNEEKEEWESEHKADEPLNNESNE